MKFQVYNWEKIINYFWLDFVKYFWEKRDKRMDSLPLMGSPLPTLYLMAGYTFVCLVVGPKLMQNRKPFEIRKAIVLFNVIMVFINLYMHWQMWTLAWAFDYSWLCQPLDRSSDPRSLKIASISYLYYICKYVDWIDTLFFILRKKFSHVSALHIYHHTFMPSCAWFGARFMPGGHGTFMCFLNTGVHVVMHTYYTLAAMGPKYQKYLWWKRYLTMFQLVQFLLIILHGGQVLFIYECGIDLPLEWGYYFGFQACIFIFLFGRFYIQTYTKPVSIEKNNAQIGMNNVTKIKSS
uniref:Elongation of very long chain fatty acids protein n=1 Tax=Strigamia maritima TaxID=126957 RepID=T1ILK2_STRMM